MTADPDEVARLRAEMRLARRTRRHVTGRFGGDAAQCVRRLEVLAGMPWSVDDIPTQVREVLGADAVALVTAEQRQRHYATLAAVDRALLSCGVDVRRLRVQGVDQVREP